MIERWWKRRRSYKQRQCQHLNAITLYGDAIRFANWHRGHCTDCGLLLDERPARDGQQ